VDLHTEDIGSFEIGEQPCRSRRWFVCVALEKKDKGQESHSCADPKPIGS
jgi:hypothetical protein